MWVYLWKFGGLITFSLIGVFAIEKLIDELKWAIKVGIIGANNKQNYKLYCTNKVLIVHYIQ